ncbi:MAG: aminoacyl-tRNA hydrolase [bacterium]
MINFTRKQFIGLIKHTTKLVNAGIYMFLIIGLGNPGQKYQNTRHSVGFMATDVFNKKHNFSPFRLNKKSNALESDGIINDRAVKIIKPQTFMNNSGKAIKQFNGNRSQKEAVTIIVIHDDADLPVGDLKISKNRGSAGHHGVESVIKEIKTKDFTRIRIGVCPMRTMNISGKNSNRNLVDFVLKPFSKAESALIERTINLVALALETIIVSGTNIAMNDFNNH